MSDLPATLIEARFPEHLQAVRRLFEQYAASLSYDLGFQDFPGELAGLPGDYAPPNGALLLAERAGEHVGCVALRRIDEATCEMKRLFVATSGRGRGMGAALAGAIIATARERGYRRMRLDTMPSMQAARHLYESLGFREISPYRYNPVEGATFMELAL